MITPLMKTLSNRFFEHLERDGGRCCLEVLALYNYHELSRRVSNEHDNYDLTTGNNILYYQISLITVSIST